MPNRLEVGHSNYRRRVSREAGRLIARAWVMANGNEDAFVAEAVAVAASARAATVAEVDAYLATYLTAQGVSASPRGLDPDAYRRPIGAEQQWQRPFTQMRVKLSDGMEFPQAFQFGRHAATTMIATDLQFASRTAASDWMGTETRISGYRRILGAGKNCELCIAASDQRYHIADLMPIHDNCGCSVAPMLDGDTRAHGLSEGRYQASLAESGVQVAEHGELGPYLFNASHSPPLLNAAA